MSNGKYPFHLPVLDKDLYATPNGHVTDIAGGAFVVSGGGITETESNAPFGVRVSMTARILVSAVL